MKHPSSESLALLAGEDLSMMEAIPVRWHLRGCSICRGELEAASRSILVMRTAVMELPEGLDWDSLAAEMRGNINVGLEASQAISSFSKSDSKSDFRTDRSMFDWRPAVAVFAIAVVTVMGWFLNTQRADHINNPSILLEANSQWIEWKQGNTSLAFRTRSAEGSFVTVDTKGVASSRYVDSETGQVAITNVYVD